ncbi:hypothetical protein KFK09_004855 [Dendrobium nobile]|uniref:Uncharacterized protein n=1 Tax=Dendrobium nobile TaxID=94219 RepID=A0A8T3BZN1_DENNO|nr:hypothetical protein KFK09_004855 [Dendrobium nobile]
MSSVSQLGQDIGLQCGTQPAHEIGFHCRRPAYEIVPRYYTEHSHLMADSGGVLRGHGPPTKKRSIHALASGAFV